MEEDCTLDLIVLYIERFPRHYTEEAASTLTHDVLEHRGVTLKLCSVTTDNNADIRLDLRNLRDCLTREARELHTIPDSHVKCIAQVIYLVVRQLLAYLRTEIGNSRQLLNLQH